jgi:segregation and condensation protein B
MDSKQLKFVIEAAMLAAGRPLGLDKLQALFGDGEPPARQDIRAAIMELQADYAERGIELIEVGSGFRIQIKATMTHQLDKLWEERPPRYSRALLETLAIIAYRQPVTRGEIEDIRGVAVSTNIIRTMLERDWIKVVGHRDVPGKPALFGTTKGFLDYFGLRRLDDLPPLSELKDFDKLNVQLDLPGGDVALGGGDGTRPEAKDAQETAELEQDFAQASEAEALDALTDAAVDVGVGSEAAADDSVADSGAEASFDPMTDESDEVAVSEFAAEDDAALVDAATEAGNVTSLDDARAAAAQQGEHDAEEPAVDGAPATVVPLKQP